VGRGRVRFYCARRHEGWGKNKYKKKISVKFWGRVGCDVKIQKLRVSSLSVLSVFFFE
jgi:hypothetical protein